MRSSAVIVTRVAAEISHSASAKPAVTHQTCFSVRTRVTVSSITRYAAAETSSLISGATSSRQTSSSWRKPSRASRNRRNGTSARTIRKEIAAAKLISPLRRNASSTSGASLRASTAKPAAAIRFRYPHQPPGNPEPEQHAKPASDIEPEDATPEEGMERPETEAPDPEHVVEERHKDD